jgi:hypothetical protein
LRIGSGCAIITYPAKLSAALDVEALINLDETFRRLLPRRASRKPWIIAIRKNEHALEGSTY